MLTGKDNQPVLSCHDTCNTKVMTVLVVAKTYFYSILYVKSVILNQYLKIFDHFSVTLTMIQ